MVQEVPEFAVPVEILIKYWRGSWCLHEAVCEDEDSDILVFRGGSYLDNESAMNLPWYLLCRSQVECPTSEWWDLKKYCILVKLLYHSTQGSHRIFWLWILVSVALLWWNRAWESMVQKVIQYIKYYFCSLFCCLSSRSSWQEIYYYYFLGNVLFLKKKYFILKTKMFIIITCQLQYLYYLFLVLIAAHMKPSSSVR